LAWGVQIEPVIMNIPAADPRHTDALRFAARGYTAIEISRAVDGKVLDELVAAGLIESPRGPRARVTLTPAGAKARVS
jgi:hypothetical protein